MLNPIFKTEALSGEKANLFRREINVGAWCLIASGILTLVGLLLRGPIIDHSIQPRAFAMAAASSQHVWAWSLLLPSLVIQLYGFLGLHAFLAETSQHRWASAGVVLSVAGNGLFLPFAGIIAFVTPVVAKLSLDGNGAVIQIAAEGLTGTFATPFLLASALFLLLGSTFFGIAIWRSQSLPKWAAVPYAVHSLLIGFVAPHSYLLELTGGGLLFWSSAWIAWRILRSTHPSPCGG